MNVLLFRSERSSRCFLRKGCVSNGATAPSLPGSGRKTHWDSSAGTFMDGEALLYVLTG